MTSLTVILSLLSALAATSYSLSCTQCISTSSTTCTGPSMTCSSGQMCGSAYTVTGIGGISTSSLVRTCTPSSQCNVKGSISIKEGQIRMVTACCNTDDCTPTIPALPATATDPNGVTCRSCVSADSTWCYTPDTVQCKGDENMCLLQTTKITGSISSSTAIRGCATKSFCDISSQSQTIGGISTELKITCTNDGISVHKIVLTPAIVCLLLLKWVF